MGQDLKIISVLKSYIKNVDEKMKAFKENAYIRMANIRI